MTDRINTNWGEKGRIGECIPHYKKERFLDIENKIISLCSDYNIECKFNVGARIGGIPPKGDKTPIINPSINSIMYHDVMGGIWINSRNAEVNCRKIDNVLYEGTIDQELVEKIIDQIHDKYELSSVDTKFGEVIFLPGSNIRHIANSDRIEEILLDFPNSMVKPHPIQTDIGWKNLREKYGDRLIDKDVSGYQILNNCSMLWTTYNSEIGLIAALKNIQFGEAMIWKYAFECLYSPIYRHFKYRDVKYNFEVIAKVLSSKKSGFIFPWQDDWEERVEIAIDNIRNEWQKETKYPYSK